MPARERPFVGTSGAWWDSAEANMEAQSSERRMFSGRDGRGEGRDERVLEIPATMPFPEYGESVPVSSVQLVD